MGGMRVEYVLALVSSVLASDMLDLSDTVVSTASKVRALTCTDACVCEKHCV